MPRRRRSIAGGVLLVTASAAGALATAGSDYRLSGRRVDAGSARLAGGEYELAREPVALPAGGDFVLAASPSLALSVTPEGAICFCADPIFADGFESNDTSAWSLTEP